MYIKNALRLLINNLTCCYKTMLYRLIVVVVFLGLGYGVVYFGSSVIMQSAELKAVMTDIQQLWQQFIGIDFESTVDIRANIDALMKLIGSNIGRIIWSIIGLALLIFLMNWVLGLCNFTIAEMIDRHMSAITKCQFIPTFLQSFKKAALFEFVYTLLKTLLFVICVVLLIGIVVLTGRFIGLLSVLLGLWVVICVAALFYALTSSLRFKVINGMSIRQALKSTSIPKGKFATVFATYIFSLVFIIYLNVTMFITTFGAGVMVSLPLTYLYLICTQGVIYYTFSERKYYIDYDHIVVPKELRSEDEKLLSDVEI